MERRDVDGMRYYFVDGIAMPSVTTIIHNYTPESTGLQLWKKKFVDWEVRLAQAATVGTLVHYRIAQYFSREFNLPPTQLELDKTPITPEMSERVNLIMGNFEALIKKEKMKPSAIELSCWHRKAHYAGTVDWLGEFRGRRVLLDWKTSSGIYPSHLAQVVAYKRALLSDPRFEGGIDACFVVVVNDNCVEIREVREENAALDLYWQAFDAFQMCKRPQKQWITKELL